MVRVAGRRGVKGRSGERAGGPALLALALVAACGGGGSTPPPPATNHAPAATAASVSVDEDGALPIVLSGTDADGDPLTFQVTPPSHGTLEGTPPSLTYRPTPLFHGTDAFTFTVSDGRLTSALATVQIEVTHVNHPPTALAGQAQAQEDGSVTFDLAGSDPDGDPLGFAVASPPSHGTLVLAGASATYTPTPLWSGSDTFTFTVSDGQATSAPATVALAVTHVNHPPVAVADAALTPRDRPVTIDVLANDHDPDGDPLTPSLATPPTHGSAAVAGTRIVYTPEAGWVGDDAFTYQVGDGAGGTATGQVTVQVLAPGALAGTTAFGSKGGSLGLTGLAPLADGSFVVAGVFDGTLVLGAVPSYRTFNAGTDLLHRHRRLRGPCPGRRPARLVELDQQRGLLPGLGLRGAAGRRGGDRWPVPGAAHLRRGRGQPGDHPLALG